MHTAYVQQTLIACTIHMYTYIEAVYTLTGHENWGPHLISHAGFCRLDGLWRHANGAWSHHGVELVVGGVLVGRERVGEQGGGGSQLGGNGSGSPGRLVS